MKTRTDKPMGRLGIAVACSLFLCGAAASYALEKAGAATNAAPNADEQPAQPAGKAIIAESAEAVTNAQQAVSAAVEAAQDAVTGATAAVAEAPSNAVATAKDKHRGLRTKRDAMVAIGSNAELKAGETAQAVVAIGGNATVKGQVSDAVVAVLGNVEVSGEVGDAVVAVMGNVKLLPGAKVRGEVVSVGGKVERADGAEIGGQVQEINLGALGVPELDWLKLWVKRCVFLGRPLSLGVGWVWAVTGVFFLLYLLIALAFPGAVQACLNPVSTRPATTLLAGLLAKVLLPFAAGLLLITGIGVFALPFLFVAVMLAQLVGKVALFVYLGQQLARPFQSEPPLKPLMAFLLGWLLVTLVYLVPFLGLFTMVVLGIWALGAAVMALIHRSRREAPPKANSVAPATPPASGFAPAAPPVQAFDATQAAVGAAAAAPPVDASFATPLAAPGPIPAVLPEALALPKAGFWERMAAGFLDMILIGIASGLLHWGPSFLLVSVAYFAGMWTWKGTSIGGIVLNLRVARLDGQPINFAVGLVRTLAAWFSAVVLFLGFLWIAWDRDRQGWHDRIAGTVVVRQPRGTPLLTL